jgi:esterase/lipase superfamily enzyme
MRALSGTLATFLVAAILVGCQATVRREPEPPLDTVRGRPRGVDFVEVEVFYATDRLRTGSTEPVSFYGTGRGALEYGVASVSIPERHKRGELESPSWWRRIIFSPDPSRYMTLLDVSPMTSSEFRHSVVARTGTASQRNIFVFIHGFNVTFEDAVRRTAQIAYDLQFPGTPITYSWPSQGSTAPFGYTTDENNVEWTEPHLRQFLLDLKAGLSGDVRIHLIAHSMGNRALTKVLQSLGGNTKTALFNQVVLAAPDIDREVFERDIAPAMVRTAARTTMYASSQDRALMLSEKVHSYVRAGQSHPPLVFVQGMDTVDASGVDTSTLGHSYLADEPLLLNDLFLLIRHNLAPGDRNLRGLPPGQQRYWSFLR